MNRVGKQTLTFTAPVYIHSFANIGGKKESEGPLADTFDILSNDTTFGEETWEKAEQFMQKTALETALSKGKLEMPDLDFIIAGDLLNQCTASSYAHGATGVPFMGLYGACSTMAEALALGAMTVHGGYAKNSAAVVSSHFCTAERQYRKPLHYGGQRPQTSQWTVTGSGAVIISRKPKSQMSPRITHALIGKIVDLGITDENNMGAAMAPSAYESLLAYFRDTCTAPSDYDLIVTGDLGKVGSEILKTMLLNDGIDIKESYNDCGVMIFSKDQDAHAGGSGCGCSAVVLCGHILRSMELGLYEKVLFCGTGALLSPTTVTQGDSIAGITHIVCIES